MCSGSPSFNLIVMFSSLIPSKKWSNTQMDNKLFLRLQTQRKRKRDSQQRKVVIKEEIVDIHNKSKGKCLKYRCLNLAIVEK